ncbi:MAG: ABC transporter substrate binding protein [Sulfuriferula sp.]
MRLLRPQWLFKLPHFLSTLLCLALLLPVAVMADNLRVLVVLSSNAAPYQAFAGAYAQNLPGTMRVEIQGQAESYDRAQKFDLVVTVGVKASQFVAARTATPVLAVMLPKRSYEDSVLRTPHSKEISAIYLDQPWERQVDLIRVVLPGANKVGVLHSAAMGLDTVGLGKALSRRGLELGLQLLKIPDALFVNLDTLLDSSDVLLAVPDSEIYSSNNIRNILLTTYRRGIPLIGLSQAYVNAGALSAVFSTPEQIAAQASAETLAFAQTHQLPEPQYPSLFKVAVNQDVARTLSVPIQSAEMVKLQMDSTKGRGW